MLFLKIGFFDRLAITHSFFEGPKGF